MQDFSSKLGQDPKLSTLSGFSLVELLIVVVILGIISAVGIPAYLNQAKSTKISAAKNSAASAARACAAFLAGDSTGVTFINPANVIGSCNPIGTVSSFTYTKETRTSATLEADGRIGEAVTIP